MKDFKKWFKDREAAYEMEKQIIADKLAQGIAGIEWLVYHTEISDVKKTGLEHWLEFVLEQRLSWIEVAADAFAMDSGTFHKKYQLNWWICVDEAISALKVMRDVNSEAYQIAIAQIHLLQQKGGGPS